MLSGTKKLGQASTSWHPQAARDWGANLWEQEEARSTHLPPGGSRPFRHFRLISSLLLTSSRKSKLAVRHPARRRAAFVWPLIMRCSRQVACPV